MSALGDFLESLLSPRAPFQTAQATIQEWCDESAWRVRARGSSLDSGIQREAADTSSGEVRQKQYRAWVRFSDRARIESSMTGPKGPYSTLFVLSGDAWQYRGPNQEVEEGKLEREFRRSIMPIGFDPIEGLLDREQIRTCLPELKLREAEVSMFAGQKCVRIVAAVDEMGHRRPFHFPFNVADRYEFLADLERGLFLRKAAYLGERLIGYREMETLEFDVELDEQLFAMPQPRPTGASPKKRKRRGEMTLKDAIAAAPFALLLPPDWPEPDFVSFKAPDEQADTEFVALTWHDAHHTNMELSRQAIPEMKELVWEDAMAGDRAVRIADMEMGLRLGDGMKVLFMELAGTFAMIASTMPQKELLEFAGSLKAVEKSG